MSTSQWPEWTDAEDPARERSRMAFARAIEECRLSADPWSAKYAGDFIYLCTRDRRDWFQHRVTREILK